MANQGEILSHVYEKKWKYLSIGLLAVLVTSLVIPQAYAASLSIGSNSLFIGDNGNNSVKLIDVASGKYGGVFVSKSDTHETYTINGVTGVIFVGNNLLVSSPNFGPSSVRGQILKFDATSGAFKGALVSSSDPNAPLNPRGIVLGANNVLYVADLGDCGFPDPSAPMNCGALRTYDTTTGQFLAKYDATSVLSTYGSKFNPRGLVFGPDGLLYISVFDAFDAVTGNPLTGYVLTFNPTTHAFNIFVQSDPTNNFVSGLHRPEGLVFDSSGNLWVTSFRASASDTDKLLSFDPSGNLRSSSTITLDSVGGPRTYAQAILFGPNGKLFAPIATTGELRSYDTSTHSFTTLEPASNPLKTPWYLTFRGTDPGTLAYHTFP